MVVFFGEISSVKGGGSARVLTESRGEGKGRFETREKRRKGVISSEAWGKKETVREREGERWKTQRVARRFLVSPGKESLSAA